MNEIQPTVKTEAIELPQYQDEADQEAIASTSPAPVSAPARRSWWRGRKAITILVIVLVLIILAAVLVNVLNAGHNKSAYFYTGVRQGNLSLTVDATGVVQATTYNLDFAAAGTVQEIDVNVGQTVTKGQVLAKLNATTLENALAQAKDALKQQKDNSSSQDAINIAQDQVNVAQANLNGATLTAPAAGLVTAINGTVGGSPTSARTSSTVSSNATGFLQIVDTAKMQVLLNVNEANMGHIAKGNTASFTVDAYQNHTFSGTVSAVSHLAQTINNVVTYPVTLDVDQKDASSSNLLPGMTASATVTAITRSSVLLLPVNAVSFAQQQATQGAITPAQVKSALASANTLLSTYKSSASGGGVEDDPNPTYVLEISDGHYVLVPVVLGLSDGTHYEVLAGLTTSSIVVVSQATAGAPIAPSGPNGAPAGGPGKISSGS